MLRYAIKQNLAILSNPEKEFSKLENRQFESVLSDYLIMLVSVSILTGIVSFLFYLGKSLYLDIFLTIDVQYVRMINYSLGRSTSLMFFYLFAGTFFVFFLSLILSLFFRKIKLIKLLSLIFYASAPFLIFSWVPVFALPLSIWSIFLFIQGVKSHKHTKKISKDSIEHRD